MAFCGTSVCYTPPSRKGISHRRHVGPGLAADSHHPTNPVKNKTPNLTGAVIVPDISLWLLRLSIVLLAGFSAYAAVAGLGAIFHATYWPIVITGVALELAKYTSVQYSYQQWASLNWLFRTLLIVFIASIMTFTSVGVFGYLGSSFQTSFLSSQKNALLLTQLEEQRTKLTARLTEIDRQVSQLPTQFVKGRISLMQAFDDERRKVQEELVRLDSQVLDSKNKDLDIQAHLGPVTYFAQVLEKPVAKVVGWMIVALTLCLDPFAMFLTILASRRRSVKTVAVAVTQEEAKPEAVGAKQASPEAEQAIPTASVAEPVDKVADPEPPVEKDEDDDSQGDLTVTASEPAEDRAPVVRMSTKVRRASERKKAALSAQAGSAGLSGDGDQHQMARDVSVVSGQFSQAVAAAAPDLPMAFTEPADKDRKPKVKTEIRYPEKG